MRSKEPGTAFENISQRVVFSYRRQLSEFVPVVPEHLSLSERRDVQVSQRELAGFFRAFYESAYDHPEMYGLPLTEDVYMDEGNGKEEKQETSRRIKTPREKMAYGVDFLYLAGQRGVLVNRQLRLGKEEYASFFAKGPRVKRRFLKGMEAVGLTLSEQGEAMMVGNIQYPNMMLALKALAEACSQRDDQHLSGFLFARCDFCALDTDYQPNALDLLRTATSPAEYEHAVQLHHVLTEMAYAPILGIGHVWDWKIQYQGQRAIKTTPFFEFEYDDRRKNQLIMRIKCASTNRLVPLLAGQPTVLQQDFYRHAHNCGAPKCNWCKTRKALGPSELEYAGDKKTICWWMQRQFTQLDGEVVDLVKHYALLHEALLQH